MIGVNAGSNNATGSANTFLGSNAGQGAAASSAANNVCVGFSAGAVMTSAQGMTFVGYQAGLAQTSGTYGTYIGAQAGTANTTGARNTFVGQNCGATNQTAADITAVGNLAGLTTTAANGTFVGSSAGQSVSSGADNSTFGYNSAATLTTGANNLILGSGSNVAATSTAGAIVLGKGASGATNSVIIGLSLVSAVTNDLLIRSGDSGLERSAAATMFPSDGAGAMGMWLHKKVIVTDVTSPVTLTVAQSGSIFNNSGASGAVTYNLPAAAAGLVYGFAVITAQNLIVDAAAGDLIYIGSSASSAGGTATSNTIGSALYMVAIDATNWVCLSDTGTWVTA